MRFRLVPSKDEFFVLFTQSASNMLQGVIGLRDLVENFNDLPERHQRIKDCERRGDEFTRQILRNLDTTFVTPFDREDIHALAEQLDDVVDDVYHVSEVMSLIPLKEVLPEFRQQVGVLARMADKTVELVDRLSDMKGLRPLLDEVDALESEGDAIYRSALARLFSGEFEALEVLKWKDLVEAAEEAIDKLEDLSDTIASILVKHA